MTPRRTIAVVTGSRAEFGLLHPVMHAIDEHPDLELAVVVTGSHLLPPAYTGREVSRLHPDAVRIDMQRPDDSGRCADAAALGRGIEGLAGLLAERCPDVVLVLGDRIEAFAAASAAAVAGIRVAHLHGGDVAEGIADEGLRHAITKLAHVHLPATARAAERIIAMGEEPIRVHLVGSPAIDGLAGIPPLDGEACAALGEPEILCVLHPVGDDDEAEQAAAGALIEQCGSVGRVLVLHPNHDPGREGIMRAIAAHANVPSRPHLERREFVGLLRRVQALVGNSSAGLIECAALPRWCINVGHRQAGRDRLPHVVDCPDPGEVATALRGIWNEPLPPFDHPYGPGEAGPRTARALATFRPDNHPLTKRNTY